MTEYRKIENLLRTAKFESNPEVNKDVLQDLLEHLNGDEVQFLKKPGLGRHFMVSKVSKLAATAVVVIFVYSAINYFSGNNKGVALGAVLEAMQKMSWIHTKGTVRQGDKTLIHEEWECFNPKITITIDPDGVINYRDYSKGVTYIYQPASKTVTIAPTTDRFNQTSPESPTEIVQFMVKQFESQGGKVNSKKATMNQKRVEIFSMVDKYQEHTLIVDSEKNLPLSMDSMAHLPETNEEASSSVTFDYPQDGPMDIFSLDIPKDVQIVDNRPQGSTKNLINEIQKQYDAGFEDHIAVSLESYVEDDNTLEPMQIVVMQQNGKLKRLDRYHAFNFRGRGNTPSLYSEIKDGWPELTIQNILDLADDKFAEYQLVYDGKATNQRLNDSGREEFHSINTDMFQLDGVETLANFTWCNPSSLMMSYSDFQTKTEIIPEDPNHKGLAGLRFISTMSDQVQRLPGTTIKRRINNYWFDPAKNYMLVEQSSQAEMDEGTSQSFQKITQAAQTESGKWYPKVIVIESSSPGANGKINHTKREQRIIVETNPGFEEGIFEKIKTSE